MLAVYVKKRMFVRGRVKYGFDDVQSKYFQLKLLLLFMFEVQRVFIIIDKKGLRFEYDFLDSSDDDFVVKGSYMVLLSIIRSFRRGIVDSFDSRIERGGDS